MALKYPSKMSLNELGFNDGDMPFITFKAYKYKLPTALVMKSETNREDAGAEIQLYMPSGFQEGVGAEWGFESLLNMQQSVEGMASSVARGLLKQAGEAAGPKIMNTVLANGNPGTLIPSEFLIFKRPNPYTMNLSFNFVPRSADEGSNIVDIIETFKYHTLPSVAKGEAQFVLSFPNVWDISFENIAGPGPYGGNTYYNMACTNMNVSYSGGANSSLTFYDDVPVQCQLSLQFQSIQFAMREN